jgi:predicted transcriptional regulator
LTDKQFRTDVLVLKRFASSFHTNTYVKKTNLQLESRLRWNSFIRYLEWLNENNYICPQDREGSKVYVLTDNGKKMFDKLFEFLEYVK